MNTNDFYKELFEKYALDEEKIRKNAIKAAKTPAWQRAVSAHWKTAVGAAAAVAVTVGAVTYAVGSVPPGVDIVTEDNLPSASQRVHDAEQNYYNPPAEDISDMYVSFLDTISYSDMSISFSALSDSDDVTAECLWLNDGTVIRGAAEISAFAESSASVKCISGARISAPADCFRDIWRLSCVYVVEFASDTLNDDTFVPIPYDDRDPLMDPDFITTTAQQPSVTTSFSFVGETTPAPAQTTVPDSSTDTTQPPEDTTDAESDSSATDGQPDVIELDEDEAQTTSVTEETFITEEPPAEVTVSVTEITDAPEIGLMTQIYQLNVENALDTVLINNYAIVLTRTEAYFYKLGGVVNGQAKICELSNPKIAYSDSSTVMLTGCGTDGLRNVLVVFDMENEFVYSNDLSSHLGASEVGTISYNATENRFFLKAVSSQMTYLYEITPGADTGVQLRPLCEFGGAVSVAGYANGELMFTASEDSVNYNLYSLNCASGELRTVQNFGNSCKVRRSPTLESFIIIAADAVTGETVTYVYDTALSALIPVQTGNDPLIAVKNGTIYIFSDGASYVLSASGALAETNETVSYTNSTTSSFVIISSDSDKIVVAENNVSSWG